MKITPEMMAKLENCKSAEEIMDLAKKNNFALTKEQAQKLFDFLQSEDVSYEKMKNVFGGETTISTLAHIGDCAGIGGGGNNGGAIYN